MRSSGFTQQRTDILENVLADFVVLLPREFDRGALHFLIWLRRCNTIIELQTIDPKGFNETLDTQNGHVKPALRANKDPDPRVVAQSVRIGVVVSRSPARLLTMKLRARHPGKPADPFRLKLGARRFPEERSTPNAHFCKKCVPGVANDREGLALRAQNADTGHHRVTCLRDSVGSIAFSSSESVELFPSLCRHRRPSCHSSCNRNGLTVAFGVDVAGGMRPAQDERCATADCLRH
ncbi:hypothetical protein K438DRAFT_1946497 [Mycena galopus ATCC 62051]|nr:hypothetical protein K438DRAFT_1946497 [Mycena galopus ATCC 62051]